MRAAVARLCHHCDGIAFGTTAEALRRHGVLTRLAAGPLAIEDIAAATPAIGSGLLEVACRLLCAQGYATMCHATRRGGVIALSERGQALARNPRWYAGASADLAWARRLLTDLLDGEAAAGDAFPPAPVAGVPGRIAEHRRGAAVAAAVWGLSRRDLLAPLADGMRPLGGALGAARVLAEAGWAEVAADGRARLTPPGRATVELAAQYAYPLSYLTLLADPFGAPPPPGIGAAETHVDRALDIAFSAEVFARTTGRPILDRIAPFFDTGDPAREPVALVDTGCGDGTLLEAAFHRIRARCRRGESLASHPVRLIGIEFSDVALEATRARLAALGAPFHAMRGDIGDPAGIAASLAARQIDPLDVLHVSKSVFHNRRHVAPSRLWPMPVSTATFVAPDGGRIAAVEAFSGLVELFEAWAPFIARHGMVVAEAHTADPEAVSRHLGANLVTLLDATHGYSRQLLMEADTHLAARAAAGLVATDRAELHAAMVGTPLVTVETARVPG